MREWSILIHCASQNLSNSPKLWFGTGGKSVKLPVNFPSSFWTEHGPELQQRWNWTRASFMLFFPYYPSKLPSLYVLRNTCLRSFHALFTEEITYIIMMYWENRSSLENIWRQRWASLQCCIVWFHQCALKQSASMFTSMSLLGESGTTAWQTHLAQ